MRIPPVCGLVAACTLLLVSCSTTKKATKTNVDNLIGIEAEKDILTDSNLTSAHVGICIYDVAENKYLYNYQAHKYFIPASNMKLLTCYAAMKNLGDSLVGLRYDEPTPGSIIIAGTGDPTFLQAEFKKQPVYDFLKSKTNISYVSDVIAAPISPFGMGWAWDDYQDDYMAERSEMPIYGNCVKFSLQADTLCVTPTAFYNSGVEWFNGVLRKNNAMKLKFKITRSLEDNDFHALSRSVSQADFSQQYVPFKTILNKKQTFLKLLEDTLGLMFGMSVGTAGRYIPAKAIHSQPTDSLLKITMHRSDNFYAEQTLLMVSNEKLKIMNDAKIIDTLLKTDFSELPQKVKWVDGSGLSRYNLVSPQDFVWILNKMNGEFSWQRITTILETGNTGTLGGYYKNYSGRIYAKTGTLSNNVALSGYLITAKGKKLIFSILVNNHQTGASTVRRAVEKFLISVIENY